MIYLQDTDFTLYNGDALEVLRGLPAESVHMCVTSPPFYGLRDYGTGRWEGAEPAPCPACDGATRIDGNMCKTCMGTGEIECDHTPPMRVHGVYKNGQGQAYQSSNTNWDAPHKSYGATCGKCGATRVDRQIGLEATPEQWVAKLVDVFREVRRVLRRDGSLWLEVGDSYASNGQRGDTRSGFNARYFGSGQPGKNEATAAELPANIVPSGCKPKDLIGAPWLLAFALRADGWYLRSDIVWSRPNPMPESVTDRPTKSHSYVFLLTKSSRYFFDQEAVREPHSEKTWFYRDVMPTKPAVQTPDLNTNGTGRSTLGTEAAQHPAGRNVRSVWNINERDEHENEAEISVVVNGELVGRIPVPAGEALSRLRAHGLHAEAPPALVRDVWQIATQPYAEAHFATYPEELVRRCILAGSPVGGVVLDPFGGSGTTALVARKHNRRSILIELNESYCALAAERTRQLSLLGDTA